MALRRRAIAHAGSGGGRTPPARPLTPRGIPTLCEAWGGGAARRRLRRDDAGSRGSRGTTTNAAPGPAGADGRGGGLRPKRPPGARVPHARRGGGWEHSRAGGRTGAVGGGRGERAGRAVDAHRRRRCPVATRRQPRARRAHDCGQRGCGGTVDDGSPGRRGADAVPTPASPRAPPRRSRGDSASGATLRAALRPGPPVRGADGSGTDGRGVGDAHSIECGARGPGRRVHERRTATGDRAGAPAHRRAGWRGERAIPRGRGAGSTPRPCRGRARGGARNVLRQVGGASTRQRRRDPSARR